jgi:hypothetical protein
MSLYEGGALADSEASMLKEEEQQKTKKEHDKDAVSDAKTAVAQGTATREDCGIALAAMATGLFEIANARALEDASDIIMSVDDTIDDTLPGLNKMVKVLAAQAPAVDTAAEAASLINAKRPRASFNEDVHENDTKKHRLS